MTLTVVQPPSEEVRSHRPNRFTRLKGWAKAHWYSLCLLSGLLIVVGLAHGVNMTNYPAHVSDDEGTYMAQAWAMVAKGQIAHFTYWYDHPFLGWAFLAPYLWIVDALGFDVRAVSVGRGAMLTVNLASCVFLYALSRRIGFNRGFGTLAVLLFALSPLAMHYHRMVFLDNIAIMWALAALVIAASPRRSWAAALGSAACFAAAVLTKETTLVLLPGVVWLLVQHTGKYTRSWNLWSFITAFLVLCFAYPLYAILKIELLPGPGHVSLVDAIKWQLLERPSEGSLLDPNSGTFGLARSWAEMDPWLLLTGVALVPVGLAIRRLRPIAVAIAIQVVLTFRDGYLPYPYVIAILPFAALLIAGVGDVLWKARINREPKISLFKPIVPKFLVLRAGPIAVAIAILLFGVLATPQWGRDLHRQTTVQATQPWEDATQWITNNVPKDATLVVDDIVWPDLARRGYTRHIWHYKVDLDPEVMSTLLPNGWSDIDYVVLGPLNTPTLKQLPTVTAAIRNSKEMANFGDGTLIARKVQPSGS